MSLLVSLRMQMNSMFDISSDLVKKHKKKRIVLMATTMWSV